MKTNEDLTIMWSAFYYWEINSQIEVDVRAARSTGNIPKKLKRLQPSLDDKI